MRRLALLLALLPLAACTSTPPPASSSSPVEVQILAINDFHGNLEPPGLSYDGEKGKVPVGGAAYLASALKERRTAHSITVAAGDLISASPLVSSLYYDEPTIRMLSDSGLALAAVGNHEFDRGPAELKRMQQGGCRPSLAREIRQSCKLEDFNGASFQYLAANVVEANGQTFFPATAIRDVGGVRIGFIGMTLKETGTLVAPSGVRGLAFLDEAGTANALVPYLKQAGAQAIVLLIHQGGSIDGRYDDPSCPGLAGAIVPIVERLDSAIGLVVSGHTHNAYICNVPVVGGGSRLLTSAGKYGGMITDIRLSFGPDGSLSGGRGSFVPVQGEAVRSAKGEVPLNPAYRIFPADRPTADFVARYREAAAATASRPVGRLPGPLAWKDVGNVSQAAMLIADAQYAVARDPARGAADFALMNAGGARTEILPAANGEVTYGQIFAMQPFANNVVTLSLSGTQVLELMEQMFSSGLNTIDRPNLLMPSWNVRYAFDRSRPSGQRIVSLTIDGKPLVSTRTYRVAVNNFMASGGDGFTVLAKATNSVDAGLDLDATEAWLRTDPALPTLDRVRDLNPAK